MDLTLSAKINHLRAFSSLWVFAFHFDHLLAHDYFEPIYTLNPLKILVYHGYLGVSIFFCLSGFLLTQVYAGTRPFPLTRFYSRRLLRILPSAWLIISLYTLTSAESVSSQFFTLLLFQEINAYPQPIAHLWSINRELQCYSLLPALVWLLNRYNKLGLSLLLIVVFVSLLIWVKQTHPALPHIYGTFRLRLCEFILGMLFSSSYHLILMRTSIKIMLCCLIVAILCTESSWLTWQSPLNYSCQNNWVLCINSLLCCVLTITYLSIPSRFPIYVTWGLEKIGTISYSFYLYHFLVIFYLAQHRQYLSDSMLLNFITILVISQFIAWVSYELIEKQTMPSKWLKS